MKVKELYNFVVKDEILKGHKVYVVDRKNPEDGVRVANKMGVEEFLKLQESPYAMFWTIEEVTNEE